MKKQPLEEQPVDRAPSGKAFGELTLEIAARNELAHKHARELRAAREREKFGIVSRQRLDLDR